MGWAPGLVMPLERVALAVLHRSHPVVDLLLCRRQAREVLARALDLDAAIDLDLAWVLPRGSGTGPALTGVIDQGRS